MSENKIRLKGIRLHELPEVTHYPEGCDRPSRQAKYRCFCAGIPIESARKNDLKTCIENEIGEKFWERDLQPLWNWEQYDYRILPEPEYNGLMNDCAHLTIKEISEADRAARRARIFLPPLIEPSCRVKEWTPEQMDEQEKAFVQLWEKLVDLSEIENLSDWECYRMNAVRYQLARYAWLTGRLKKKYYLSETVRHVEFFAWAIGGTAFRTVPESHEH